VGTVKTLLEYFEELEEFLDARKKRGFIGEFPVGIKSIDSITGGLDRGQIMVIGGAAGSGKTTMAMEMAFKLSLFGKKVLVLSLEMKGSELLGRLLCNAEQIDNVLLREGRSYDPEYKDKVERFKKKLITAPLDIIEDAGYRFGEIKTILNKDFAGDNTPDIVFIDFLQLIEWKGSQNEALVSYLREFQEIAKKRNIAIVVVSQLRRPMSGQAYDRPPSKYDLLGSGMIEHIAHQIFILYRGLAEGGVKQQYIAIEKNRLGRAGDKVVVDFQGQYYSFKDMNTVINEESWRDNV